MKIADPLNEAISQIIESMDTPAARWLRSLSIYKCPHCGKATIFKTGCPEHDEQHECDENGHPDIDICRGCKEHAGFCSVCGLSTCCGEPAYRPD
jgi:predicted RNA-binding Zn-ribbon protein involved in translation (DUF1610 family)